MELVHRVVDLDQPASQVATSFGVCVKTVRKWVARFEAEGAAGLCDRSSRPHRLHRPTPDAAVARIAGLRRERWTGKRIAAELGVSAATVSRALRRLCPTGDDLLRLHGRGMNKGCPTKVSHLGDYFRNSLRLNEHSGRWREFGRPGGTTRCKPDQCFNLANRRKPAR